MLISNRPIPKVLVATTFVFGGCGGGDEDVTIVEVDVTATIGSGGGTVEEGDVRLVVPDGLFDEDTEVRIRTVATSTLPLALPPGVTAVSSVFELTVDPQQSYFFDDYPSLSLPHGGEFGTVLQLEYDEDDETWEWEVLGGSTSANGIATAVIERPGTFVVVNRLDVPGLNEEALCETLRTCDDDEPNYTQAVCEAQIGVAMQVYTSYYAALGTGCGQAFIDYYACVADAWDAEPVCDEDEYGDLQPPSGDECFEAAIEACPALEDAG